MGALGPGSQRWLPLADVSVLDVIEAVEGQTDVARCVLEDRACSGGGHCALHVPWSRARAQLLDELATTPLAAVSPRSRR
jgi:DNA-binding IscR family transcriptional regulator